MLNAVEGSNQQHRHQWCALRSQAVAGEGLLRPLLMSDLAKLVVTKLGRHARAALAQADSSLRTVVEQQRYTGSCWITCWVNLDKDGTTHVREVVPGGQLLEYCGEQLAGARYQHCMLCLPLGELVLLGGEVTGTALIEVSVWNPRDGRWRVVHSLHQPRTWHSAVILDGSVYAIGGSKICP